MPLQLPVIRRWLQSGEPLLLADIDRDAIEMRSVLVRRDIRAFFAYPMIWEGHTLGFLTLSSLVPHRPSAEEATAYHLLAERAAAALVNARLHQSLRASEQEYRTLVENATELIWTLDTEGRYTFVNRQVEEVSGQRAENWLGTSYASLIPPEDLARVQQIFQETLDGKSQSFETRAFGPDGVLRYLSVNTTPLYRDGKVVGAISFGRDVTAQKEAEAALQQRMTELSTLFELSSALRGVEGVEHLLPVIVNKAVEACHTDCGSLSLLDESGEILVCRYGTGARQNLVGARLRLGQGISGWVARSGTPYVSPDFQHDPLRVFNPETPTRLPEIASDVCVPLRIGAQVVGAMHISTYAPRIFTEAEIRLLTAIADMAASAIHRTALFEQLEHRVHELSTLFDVSKMVTATLRIEDVLEFVGGAATQAVHAEGCTLFLWDEREQHLVMRAVVGAPQELIGQVKYRAGEGMIGWVFLEGRAANVPNVSADPRWKPEPEQETRLRDGKIHSVLIAPLRIGEKTLGALGVSNKIGAPAFAASDEALLTTLAGQIAIAIENARLYEDVRDLSVAAIRSLAAAIDARDPYTRGHSNDVARLAVQLARALGWNAADLEMLEFAALLHDVGKIAVPDAILRKVEPLTPDEWNVIRLHPFYSAQILKPVKPLQRIIPWVYHHQEWWDGSGYPDGLKGEVIPLAARIIAVVDAFNAITTDRPYRQAKSREEARSELRRYAGTHFDPQVVELFLRQAALD
ncbi:MAG: GAF domain-containing protein [Chloroflexi bacterium]|nr:GAF domain-containing protein [Chloroflexota bacterium]